MHLHLIDWAIIAAFLLLSLLIGLRYRNKASGGLADFFLGGRSLPWYIAGISMVATTFAADTPLAVTEMVADKGISKNWLWWSFLIGGMLTTFFFANLWRRAGVITELELITLRYGGKQARFLRGFKAVYLGLFMNCMIIGWVNLAMMSLLEAFFGLDTTTALLTTGGLMAIAVIYASLSGLLGVAITDTVQFFIAMIGCIVLAVLVINSDDVGGMAALQSKLPESYFSFFPSVGSGAESSSGGSSVATLTLSIGAFLSFVAVQWWASWYPGSEPGGGGYVAQRMMSAKNERHSIFATLFFQIGHYCLRPWPWIIVALCAVALYTPSINGTVEHPAVERVVRLKSVLPANTPEEVATLQAAFPEIPGIAKTNKAQSNVIENGLKSLDDYLLFFPADEATLRADEKLYQSATYHINTRLGYIYAMKNYLPVGLTGLLLVAFLAAYLSTISTQLNWGSSYVVNDLYLPFVRKQEDDPTNRHLQRDLVARGRWVTLLLMIISLAVTTQLTSISGVWEFIMECGAGLGLVLILRWYWWRINAWSEIAATLAPFVGYVIGHYALEPAMGQGFADNKGPFLFTVLFTTVVWLAVTMLTKPESDATLHHFYRKVRPGGWWKPVQTAVNLQAEGGALLPLTMCWIGGIAMTYSVLFATGKLLFGNYTEAGIWLAIALAGFLLLRTFLSKSNILETRE